MRKLTPELLDHLPHDDPGAIASRKDLARINLFMGNESWILRQIPKSANRITEIGAGEGQLISKIAKHFLTAEIQAYDLAPEPKNLPKSINWICGDIFEQKPTINGGILIANLFLHHFTNTQLEELSPWLQSFDVLIFNEPLRAKIPLLMGKLAHPLIHPITRHDMRVSIEAGFRPGELSSTLKLNPAQFISKETQTLRGSIRFSSTKS